MKTTSKSTTSGGFSRREIAQIMTGLLMAMSTALLANTVVYTALPPIMADLNGMQREYTWVITSSLLTMTISLVLWGKLSDLYDKKILTQISILISISGSIIAGSATSVPMLMTGRAMQGVAMGGLIAMMQAIMGVILDPRERARYAGYMGAVLSIATASGPLLGGVITDLLSWHWAFFICVPLPVIGMILIQAKLHLKPIERTSVKLDYMGAALIVVAAALPMLWITFAGNEFDWVSWQSACFIIGFLIATLLTVLVELRAANPIIPIRVLRNNTAALMILASIPAGLVLFGTAVFLAQYFQLGAGQSPTMAGVLTIPLVISQALSSIFGGQIVTRTGRWKPMLVAGGILMLVGLAGLGMINHNTGYLEIAVSMSLMGLGVGMLGQNMVLAVQNTVDVTDVGAASATIAFFRSLGGAVGVAVMGAILSNQVHSTITNRLLEMGIPLSQHPGGGSGQTDLDLSILPDSIREVVMDSYADSFGHIFLISAIVSIVTVVVLIIVKETRLRTTIEL